MQTPYQIACALSCSADELLGAQAHPANYPLLLHELADLLGDAAANGKGAPR